MTLPMNINFYKETSGKKYYLKKTDIIKSSLKETQTISIYLFYLLQNHVDTSTKSK